MARLWCFFAAVIASSAETEPLVKPSHWPSNSNVTSATLDATATDQRAIEATEANRAVRGLRVKNVTASRQLHGQNRGRFPGRDQTGGGSDWGDRFDDWGWGHRHGVRGETCCMCSRRGRRGKTILFAGGDYDHYYGSRSAHQQCDRVCELQCALRNGHKFGCYEEDDLRRITRRYSGQGNFVIRHQKWYGNIC
ncbi:3-hydroxyisobutyrate dehydrogenase [Durusdinium trenchii]|uniref:Mitochondrial n=1 Tax=Durusdinium trenchii TaxID=1381693 RepID=A0ABP0K1J2_9DINO